MPKNSRKKKPAGGASSSSHQETPVPPQLSQDRINEKNELLETLEERIKGMKKNSETHENDVNSFIFLSAVISAIAHLVSFTLRIPTMISSCNVASGIPVFVELEASRAFKEMHRIISEAITGIKPDAEGSRTVEIWRKRCRKNVEEIEKMIKKEDYKDELSIEMLDVIVMTLIPEIGRIRDASACSCCKMSNWKHKDKVLANMSVMLKVLEEDVMRRLAEAVVAGATADS